MSAKSLDPLTAKALLDKYSDPRRVREMHKAEWQFDEFMLALKKAVANDTNEFFALGRWWNYYIANEQVLYGAVDALVPRGRFEKVRLDRV